MDSDLKMILRRYLKGNDFLNSVFISNLEVPKNGLKCGKNTYMCFQLFFSQKFENEICKNMNDIRKKMCPWINDVLDEFEGKLLERGFSIHEKRKE